MGTICTVIQFGNLTFDIDLTNDDESIVSSTGELEKLSEIMGVEKENI